MKFTKKTRYGFQALIDMSVNMKDGPVALNSIAERNHISLQYLEQVFAGLRRAGIVKSMKGSQGGYQLKEEADRITAAMIVRALEGDYHIEGLKEMPEDGMPEMEKTIQDLLTDKINEKLDQVLENLTLEDMRQYYLEYGKGCRDMYYI